VTSISAANGPKQQDSYSCGDMSLMYVNFVVSNPDKLDVGPKPPWPSSDVRGHTARKVLENQKIFPRG